MPAKLQRFLVRSRYLPLSGCINPTLMTSRCWHIRVVTIYTEYSVHTYLVNTRESLQCMYTYINVPKVHVLWTEIFTVKQFFDIKKIGGWGTDTLYFVPTL